MREKRIRKWRSFAHSANMSAQSLLSQIPATQADPAALSSLLQQLAESLRGTGRRHRAPGTCALPLNLYPRGGG